MALSVISLLTGVSCAFGFSSLSSQEDHRKGAGLVRRFARFDKK